MTRKHDAELMTRDVRDLEIKGTRESRVVTKMLIGRARRSLRSGGLAVFEMHDLLEGRVRNLLRDAMLLAHLKGMRRIELLLARYMRLADPFRSAIKAAEAARSPAYVELLRDRYDVRALDLMSDLTKTAEAEMRGVVSDLVSTGAHVREGVQALGGKLESLGVAFDNPWQLENIFRTQTQLAYALGRYAAEQDPDVQEILWGYEYAAVGDDRVRPVHEELDGTRLPKDDPFWSSFYPPNGWSCRCQAIPIFDEEEPVRPPDEVDGKPLAPDKGFDFDPAKITQDMGLPMPTATSGFPAT